MRLITEDALLMCAHPPGKVKIEATERLVTIEGRRVLVETDPEGRAIVSCPNFNPPAGIRPCTRTLRVQTGYSGLLRIEGRRVCLDTVRGFTDGTPPGTVRYGVTVPGQSLVSATE
ncbi:MAG: hypothetical protein HY704_01360 [Gemmatimonadetes bacterium]|nr:hypothetical protein [Gemmatimonadota bacterium]